MSWVLQALAQLLGCEPAPGTPAHRDAYLRSCKLLNEALKQPPAQTDVAWMLEEAKRNQRLSAEHKQAEAQVLRHHAEVWMQGLAALQAEPASACCPDSVRVYQRMAASLQARAALYEALARQATERLQALQEGRPPPPGPGPRLELQLPAGLPRELPPSIDRCAECQKHLDQAMYLERFLLGVEDEYPSLLKIFMRCNARHGAAALGAAGRAPAGDDVDVAAAAEQEAAAAELDAVQLEQELAAARESAAQLEAAVAQARERQRQAQTRAEEQRQRQQQEQQRQQQQQQGQQQQQHEGG